MSGLWTAYLRRAALWSVPVVLMAALIWSVLPHGAREPVGPPELPAATSGDPTAAAGAPPRTAPSASQARGQTGPAQDGTGEGATSATAPSDPERTAAGGTPKRPSTGVASGEIKLGNLVGTDEQGHMRWQILADDMTLQQAQQTVALRHVRATFFDDDGTRMMVNGDAGTYDTRTREVTVGGDVHGVTSAGRELFADVVYYSPQSRQVEGRGHVRVIQERVIMYADRMVSDLTLGQTRFFGNVHMTLR
jgi:LPS export ABC transporter protein LptC